MNDDRISAAKRDLLTSAKDLLAKLDDAKIETDRLLDLAETIQRAAADQRPRIVRQTRVMSRTHTVEGTRVRAIDIIANLLDGELSEEQIAETYPTLPSGSVQAVIEWAMHKLYKRADWLDFDDPVHAELRDIDRELDEIKVRIGGYGPDALEALDGLDPVRPRPSDAVVVEEDGDQEARDRILREAFVIERLDDLDDEQLGKVAVLVKALTGGG